MATFGINAWFETGDEPEFAPVEPRSGATYSLVFDVTVVPYGSPQAPVAAWYSDGLAAAVIGWMDDPQAHQLTVAVEGTETIDIVGQATASVMIEPTLWTAAADDPIADQERDPWLRSLDPSYEHPGEPLARLREEAAPPFVVARFRFHVATGDIENDGSLFVQLLGDEPDRPVVDETSLHIWDGRLELVWGAGLEMMGNGPPDAAEQERTVQVFYATDRLNTGKPEPHERYSGDPGELETGVLEVSIPAGHEEGEVERPLFGWRMLESASRHVVLMSITSQDAATFFSGLNADVLETRRREVFVFIHGYNVTFEAAALRTGQMAYDLERLGLDATPILYSWPSLGKETGYVADLDAADRSAFHLAEFLSDVRARSGSDLIHLVAHSMGTRVLTGALARLAAAEPGQALFNEVVLAAPDIDVETFRMTAAEIAAASARMTLYANSHDMALNTAQALRRGRRRAGDVNDGNIVIAPGVDSIDASDLDTGFMGHSYFAEHQLVIRDITSVLATSATPAERPWLQVQEDGDRRWWAFEKG